MNKTKEISVIGSGFASLSVATTLADMGNSVTVFEKNSTPGGRARQFVEQGFTFDMGPSWYWMPDVFENYFNRFGKSTSDYYELIRLDPSYRIHYGLDDSMDIPASLEELYGLFESIEKGSSEKLKAFLNDASIKYNVGMGDMVQKPGDSILEFANWTVLKNSLKLDLLKSIEVEIESKFKHPKLQQLLKFPVLFLGAKPSKTPALYSLMNHADLSLGTWYPLGGMHKIVEGMYELALEKGVKFEFDTPINSIIIENNKASGVVSGSKTFKSEIVVAGADYEHVETNLLPPNKRQYSTKYWNSRTLAPSSLIFYLGVNKKLKNLLHHNLFFDKEFEKHAEEIYDIPKWPTDPLFYVCAPSVTDSTVAPDGSENLFILIPLAPGIEDTSERREQLFKKVMERLEKLTHNSINENIVYNRSYCINDFIEDYNSFKGNAYGLANTLKQTAFLKPKLKSKKVNQLYYTGQLTVPGPGVPPSLISGQIVADLIQNK
ncbi:MAG: phytoene desaturase family protein [Salibacteraceae bacterium]